MITLPRLLAARDARRALELHYLSMTPESTLIVLTVNIPGNVKRTPESVAVGREGVRILCDTLNVTTVCTRDIDTGFEAYLLTPASVSEAKTVAMDIEDSHPLGRLMDIDVFLPDATPVSRRDFGRDGRKCLICGGDARVCMRMARHTPEELWNEIKRLHDGYFQRT